MDDVLSRAAGLARHSDSPDHYTRTYLTPAHRAAARQLADWMREAGMEVRVDAVGSVIGRYGDRGAPTLLLGSHFDSVRNGGKYDGVLGILVPIACVAELHRRGERLRYAVEIAAFADEEGARFQTSFLASRAMLQGAASVAPLLDRRDADGVTFAEAMRAAGLDPARVDEARIDAASLAAYVEVHIEQGPVLLDRGAPLGVVTSIAGGTRLSSLASGITTFGLYGLAFVGGWVEQAGLIGGIQSARAVGIAMSLLSPADSMWRLAAYYLQPDIIRTLGNVGPFAGGAIPSALMLWWTLGFVAASLAFAIYSFRNRQL